jgi:hypothetical protein
VLPAFSTVKPQFTAGQACPPLVRVTALHRHVPLRTARVKRCVPVVIGNQIGHQLTSRQNASRVPEGSLRCTFLVGLLLIARVCGETIAQPFGCCASLCTGRNPTVRDRRQRSQREAHTPRACAQVQGVLLARTSLLDTAAERIGILHRLHENWTRDLEVAAGMNPEVALANLIRQLEERSEVPVNGPTCGKPLACLHRRAFT